MLKLWKPCRSHHLQARKFRKPEFQPLEERALLAIDTHFQEGVLRITSDEVQISLLGAGSDVKVNESVPDGGRIAVSDVRVAQFSGGPETKTIDVSGISLEQFPSLRMLDFTSGVWIDPVKTEQIADEILGPGWAQQLKISDAQEFLTSGDWREPLNDGTLSKQLTAAGWGNADGLIDEIVRRTNREARVGIVPLGPLHALTLDSLFNGSLNFDKGGEGGSREPVAEPLSFGGEGDPTLHVTGGSDEEPIDAEAPIGHFTFVVHAQDLEGTSSNINTITFDWAIPDLNSSIGVTAKHSDDYTVDHSGLDPYATSGHETFYSNGTQTFVVNVWIPYDAIPEPDETLRIVVSNVTGAELVQTYAIGTIVGLPKVSISNAEVDEDTPAGEVVLTLTMDRAASDDVVVDWETEDLPSPPKAEAALDYVSTTGQVTFEAGYTVRTITVQILDDTLAETDEQFKVKLTGISANGRLSTTASENEATVTIIDGNELPTIEEQSSPFEVPELSLPHTPVGDVEAEDPEDGAKVKFEITGGNALGIFGIGSDDGKIEIIDGRLLDYEVSDTHVLEVTVTDTEGGTATRNFTILVTDLNESPILVNRTFTIAENSTVGTPVVNHGGSVASSPDDWDNVNGAVQTITYNITSGNHDNLFDLDGSILKVNNQQLLNYEALSKRILTITASDGLLTTTSLVTVTIQDVLEDPEIQDQQFELSENSPAGTPVGTVVVAFLDAGETATFSSTEVPAGFALDSSGRITLVGPLALDYEDPLYPGGREFEFTVDVYDGSAWSSAEITIKVTDANDAPIIESANSFSVDENTAHGTAVFPVVATDVDAGDTLRYSLGLYALPAPHANPFAIDPNTGQIYLQGSLDHEAVGQYTLVVDVTDRGLLRTSQIITVTIGDVNEAPRIENQTFKIGDEAIEIVENSPVGALVGRIAATDQDAGDVLTYGISSSAYSYNWNDFFIFDSTTKELFVKVGANFTAAQYKLDVTVTDDNTPALLDTALITINVENTPDTITLVATVRDFHSSKWNPPDGATTLPHPDFQMGSDSEIGRAYGLQQGLVNDQLGPDGKPVFSGIGNWINNAQSFSTWYRDDARYNRSSSLELTFNLETRESQTAYWFSDTSFFPITGKLFNVLPISDPDFEPVPTGAGIPAENFHFTLEIQAEFTYHEDDNQYLSLFESDDDLWVFINGHLVVDIGGVHGALSGDVNLNDEATAIGLVDGQTYPIDMFFAERNTDKSNLQLFTNIDSLRPRAYIIKEQTRLVSTFEHAVGGSSQLPVTIPENPQALAVDFSNLSFDVDDPNSTKDSFEIALVDSQGNSLVPTIAVGRDSFYNATEGEQPLIARGAVQQNSSTVLLDISQLTPGTVGYLVTRLVNNDGVPAGTNDGTDTSTSVMVTGSVRFLGSIPSELEAAATLPTVSPVAEVDGTVVLEAERPTSSSGGVASSSGHHWQGQSDAAAGGDAYLAALPDIGAVKAASDGPRLDYAIEFATPGTYYVWLKMRGLEKLAPPSTSYIDGAVTVGWNGTPQSTPIEAADDQWTWQSAPATITVDSAGLHTLNLWMVEDGVQVDSIVLKQATGAPTGSEPLSPPAAPWTSRPADFSALSDVSTTFDVEYGRTSYNAADKVLFANVTLTSNGRYSVRGDTAPLLVGVTNISHPLVSLLDVDGYTPDGMPYYDVSRLGFTRSDVWLKDGDRVPDLELKFSNPSGVQFDFELVVLGALNRAPQFVSEPITQVSLNSPSDYQYTLEAVDPDAAGNPSETLVYTLVHGPAGLELNDNVITWSTTEIAAAGVGAYNVLVRATDPHGAYAIDTWTINVVNVPNRPPRFTSIPVVDAYVGETYTYTLSATDDDGDTLYFERELDPGGSFTLNGNVITWVPLLSEVGTTVEIKLHVADRTSEDPDRLIDEQVFHIFVHPSPLNQNPVIISEPSYSYERPGETSSHDGDVRVDSTQGTTITIPNLAPGEVYTDKISVDVPAGFSGVNAADIVFIVDESGSMQGEHEWLAGVAELMDTELLSKGIGAVAPNRFGIVGYGEAPADLSGTGLFPHAHAIGANEHFGSAEDFAAAAGDLVTTGGVEDGWLGIDYALRTYPFREGASINIILVTDEDRDNSDGSLTYQSVLSALKAQGAILNVVARATYRHNSDVGLGVDSNGVIYLPDGTGYTTETTAQFISAYGTTKLDYVELAHATGGAAWNLQMLRDSEQMAEAFTAAFVDMKAQEIASRLGIELVVEPEDSVFVNLSGIQPGVDPSGRVYFDIQLVGDGRPHAFDIRFMEMGTGQQRGLIPVTINPDGYVYDVDAIDPDVEDELTYSFEGNHHGANIDPGTGEITWQPSADGRYAFEVLVTDGKSGEDRQKWTVTVGSNSTGNHEPVIISTPPLEGSVDRAYQYELAATDTDGDTLSYHLLATTADGMTIDRRTGVILWSSPIAGTYELNVRVADGRGGVDEQTFTLDISETEIVSNQAPLIRSTAPTTAIAEETFRYDVRAFDADGDVLTYDLIEAPEGMVIEAGSGLIVWKPRYDQLGDFSVLVRVSDGEDFDLQRFDLNVITLNEPPSFVSLPDQSAAVEAEWKYELIGDDPNGDELDFRLDRGPAGMTVELEDGKWFASWTPQSGDLGKDFYVSIIADDLRGGQTLQQFYLPVRSNLPPQFVLDPEQNLTFIFLDEAPYSVSFGVDDPDGFNEFDDIAVTARLDDVSLARGMTITQTEDEPEHTITWNPTIEGDYPVSVTIVDTSGATRTMTFMLRVAERITNKPPRITSVPTGPAYVGQQYSYELAAVDPDEDAVEFNIESGPPSLALSEVNQRWVLTWSPTDVGTYPISIAATDGKGAKFIQSFDLPVVTLPTANDPPTIQSRPTGPAFTGETWHYVIEATDPEGQPLFYSLDQDSLNRGMTISANVVSWTPADEGNFEIEVRVTDSVGQEIAQSFMLPVRELPDAPIGNLLPEITSQPRGPAYVGQPYVYQVTATDADEDEIEYRLDLASEVLGVKIDALGKLTWSPGEVGDFLITVIADDDGDPENGYTLQHFILPVLAALPAANPPIIRSLPPGPAQNQRLYEYQLDAYDPDGDRLQYVLESAPAGMTIDQNGLIRFVPSTLQPIVARVMVRDERGLGVLQEINVPVVPQTDRNDAPKITSKPRGPAAVGRAYEYQVIASDPNGDPLTYSLDGDSEARGAKISSSSGLITWKPTARGNYRFVVTVSDGSAATMQTFDLPVVDNAPPTIVSTPVQTFDLAGEDAYLYSIDVDDPNSQDESQLQYSLDPASDSIGLALVPSGPGQATLQWTDAQAEIKGPGIYHVEITVTDPAGAAYTQRFDLQVYDSADDNQLPMFTGTPRTVVQAGQLFVQQVEAFDPDGDPIEYELVSGAPPGMSISTSGLIQWQTSAEDVSATPYEYFIRIKDNRSSSFGDPEQFSLLVTLAPAPNAAPEITSTPVSGVVIGTRYTYQAVSEDPDGDAPLSWSLDKAPAGMFVDAKTGLITWTPRTRQLGTHEVILRVTDPFGASGIQTFQLVARGTNMPPQFLTTPGSIAVEGEEYVYTFSVQDLDTPLEDLVFARTVFPAGTSAVETVEEDPTLRRIRWTPGTGDAADPPQEFKLTVSDGQITTTQTFYVTVSTDLADARRAPEITSQPILRVMLGEDYEYTVVATDADGESSGLQYSVIVPTGLETEIVFDSSPNQNRLRWNNVNVSPNDYLVQVIVEDAIGLKAVQTFRIQVFTALYNAPPVITSEAPGNVLKGTLYAYDVKASDPNLASGDFLTYGVSVVSGNPVNEPTIDRYGRLRWQSSPADSGPVNFLVLVTDSFGAQDTESVAISLLTDETGPRVDVQANFESAPVGSQVTFYVDAIDNFDGRNVRELTLYVYIDADNNNAFDPSEGEAIPVGASRYITRTLSTAGAIRYYATAKDTVGNPSASLTRQVQVFNWDDPPPYVFIQSPTSDNTISRRVDVVGSVKLDTESDSESITYSVSLVSLDPAASNARIELGSFHGQRGLSSPESLGAVIDPFWLPNGSYWLVVTAFDGIAEPTTVSRQINIQTDAKLGNFSLTFTDLEVPVAGIPVTLTRTYDTFEATRDGQFGYGWKLNIANTDLQVTGASSINGFADGTLLTITMPDGSREEFVFQAQQSYGGGYIPTNIFRPTFVPKDAKTTSRLSVPSQDLYRLGAYYIDPLFGKSYDPAKWGDDYLLTTREGLKYLIDSGTGDLISITDRHGNVLNYTSAGVHDQNGVGITLEKTGGKITAVIDPNGRRITYGYDANGDLVSVTNRANEKTIYEYDLQQSGRPHFLTAIKDARGVTVARANFDPVTGQLTGLVDAADQAANFDYTRDLGGGFSLETVRSTAGRTELVRDGLGNVIRRIQLISEPTSPDPAANRYQITIFRFDDPLNPNLQTAASIPFEHVGDAGRLDVEPANLKWASRSEYDTAGNLKYTQDALGYKTEYLNYDEFGNPSVVIDALGRRTENTYFNGLLTRTKDAEGGVTELNYYLNGLVQKVTQIDANGDRIETSFVYDGSGRLIESTDPSDITRYFVYDARGNQTLSYFHWDDPAQSAGGTGLAGDEEFDLTIVTRTYYDAEDRVKGTAQYTFDYENLPNLTAADLLDDYDLTNRDWTTSTEYNTAGQMVASTDRFGVTSYSLYDVRGNVVESRTETYPVDSIPAWIVTRTVYDDSGRAIATSDPFIVTNPLSPVDPSFTPAGDELITLAVDLRVSETDYDALGRVTESRRLDGLEISIEVIDPDPESDIRIYEIDYSVRETFGVADHILARSQTIYDGRGQVAKTITYDTTHDTDPVNEILHQVWFEYDAVGRQTATIQVVDLDQDGTPEFDDPNGDGIPDGGPEFIRTATTYDRVGQQEYATDARGTVTKFLYDKTGRLTTTISDFGGRNIDMQTKYDVLGRRTDSYDALDRRTQYWYDAQGRLTEVWLPEVTTNLAESVTGMAKYQYAYDAHGNQMLIRDPMDNDLGFGSDDKETWFTYDAFGRQKTRELPNGLTESFEYSPEGQQTLHISFEGRYTKFLYDTFGRLETKQFFADVTAYNGNTPEATVVYTYDAFGRVEEINDSAAITSNKYDAEGRLAQVISPEGIINYAYDALGRMTRTWTSTDSAGANAVTDTEYGYDALGRLTGVEVVARGGASVSELTQYFYDANGNLDLEIRPGNLVTDYQYDELNRLDLQRTFEDEDDDGQFDVGELIAEFDYLVADDGQREQVVERDDLGNVTTIDWVYDELGRLVEESFDFDDVTNTHDSTYDYVTRYGFDLASNRKKMVKDGFNSDETTTYTYDQNDRIETEIVNSTDDLQDRNTRYAYDDTEQTSKTVRTGTVIDSGDPVSTTTNAYDVRGRLETVVANDGTTVTTSTYKYNDLGIRVWQSVQEGAGTPTETVFLVDSNNHTGYAQVLEEWKDADHDDVRDSGEVTTYTLGHDVLAQQNDIVESGDTLQLVYDGHGSTRAVVKETVSGIEVLERYAYDAYGVMQVLGNVTVDASTPLTRFLYSGEKTDATGLQYLRARYYDPRIGRFTTLDPFAGNVQDPLSLHRYLYTHANPIMGVDPTGMFEGLAGIGVANSIGSIISQMNVSVGQGVISSLGFDGSLDFIEQVVSKAWSLIPDDVQDAIIYATNYAIEHGGYLAGAVVVLGTIRYSPQTLSQRLGRYYDELSDLLPVRTQWGWTGSSSWRAAAKEVASGGEAGILRTVVGKVPTFEEAVRLIKRANGTIQRVEGPHAAEGVAAHIDFLHINYTTASGKRSHLAIQSLPDNL